MSISEIGSEVEEEKYSASYRFQKVQENQQSKKLNSTPDGKSVITQTSRVLDDSLVEYHMKIARVFNIIPVTRVLVKETRNVKHSNSESFIVSELSSPESRHKRRKTLVESEARKNILDYS